MLMAILFINQCKQALLKLLQTLLLKFNPCVSVSHNSKQTER